MFIRDSGLSGFAEIYQADERNTRHFPLRHLTFLAVVFNLTLSQYWSFIQTHLGSDGFRAISVARGAQMGAAHRYHQTAVRFLCGCMRLGTVWPRCPAIRRVATGSERPAGDITYVSLVPAGIRTVHPPSIIVSTSLQLPAWLPPRWRRENILYFPYREMKTKTADGTNESMFGCGCRKRPQNYMCSFGRCHS
jgi:hypothetical protein